MKKLKFTLLCIALMFSIVLIMTRCEDKNKDDEPTAAKPVIYLYPEETMEVTVKLDYNGSIICTYPTYYEGWTVTAHPDGMLIN
ncbi:MAG: hypothetical protein QM222_04985, partial [Bacillota bacterium]|nr:hypothetical protein [Bacillota bacterium]